MKIILLNLLNMKIRENLSLIQIYAVYFSLYIYIYLDKIYIYLDKNEHSYK